MGRGCKIGPNVSIGALCKIADGVRLSNCVLLHRVEVRAPRVTHPTLTFNLTLTPTLALTLTPMRSGSCSGSRNWNARPLFPQRGEGILRSWPPCTDSLTLSSTVSTLN